MMSFDVFDLMNHKLTFVFNLLTCNLVIRNKKVFVEEINVFSKNLGFPRNLLPLALNFCETRWCIASFFHTFVA